MTITTPEWSSALQTALQQEIAACYQTNHASDQLIQLISVGGLNNQDLPMSGNLQATPLLQTKPYLYALLGCVSPALGRVCLIQQASLENTTTYPLYCNPAYPVFYQTHLSLIGDTCLLLEARREQLGQDGKNLFDLKQLTHLTETAPQTQSCLKIAPPTLDALPPGWIKQYLDIVLDHCLPSLNTADAQALSAQSIHFLNRWRTCYARFADDYAGEWTYQSVLNTFREKLMPIAQRASQHLEHDAQQATNQALQAIATHLNMIAPAPRRVDRRILLKARQRKQFSLSTLTSSAQFERPIFIVSVPRAGSTLLFETLSLFPQIWSTGEENHALLEDIPGLHPRDHAFASNRLTAKDATEAVKINLLKAFTSKLQDRDQHYYLQLPASERPDKIRFLEKTPKNALRIPFIKALFPDALLVYLHRDCKGNVSSLLDGWRSQRFIAYKNLPGFENRHWSFLLTPGWEKQHDRSIAEIAAYQWKTGNQIIQNDLARLPEQDWLSIDYHALINRPAHVVQQFADFAGLQSDPMVEERCQNSLPVSRLTLSSPQQHKWKKHQYFLSVCAKSL